MPTNRLVHIYEHTFGIKRVKTAWYEAYLIKWHQGSLQLTDNTQLYAGLWEILLFSSCHLTNHIRFSSASFFLSCLLHGGGCYESKFRAKNLNISVLHFAIREISFLLLAQSYRHFILHHSLPSTPPDLPHTLALDEGTGWAKLQCTAFCIETKLQPDTKVLKKRSPLR